MTTQPLLATIRSGISGNIREINVRHGPSTNFSITFSAPVQLGGLRVLEVEPDAELRHFGGKIFQWFKLEFPNLQIGWIRDDLLDIQGDGTQFGYGVLPQPAFAFDLSRTSTSPDPEREPDPIPIPPQPTPPQPSIDNSLERVAAAAFNITAAFEGGGYASYQNTDRGIVSYGRFQFTLQSSNLAAVVERYLEKSDSFTSQALENEYLVRIRAHDEMLRGDRRLQDLLVQAAGEQAMQDAQDEVAFERFWSVVYNLSIAPRNILFPLTQAMCFDIGIQHGTRHDLFSQAETALGVPLKSRLVDNGIAETTFAQRVAEIRHAILVRIAERDNVPGVIRRADAWLNLIASGDWNLQGNADGVITVFGKMVQVRNP
ncbi:MAG: chitosanase [Anaerolineales bacterium]|nr:chitosanase [Anaerolineales bacterium]